MKGLLVLCAYCIAIIGVAVIFTKRESNMQRFCVANRNVGTVLSTLSIAATWIWAPALFTSAEKAYTSGLPGLFWFLVPNVICLMIFAPFAVWIRKQFPEGITLSGYMQQKYKSKKIRNVYLLQLSSLSVLSTAVQLLAGGKILSMITGISFPIIVVILALIGYGCSAISGIKGSIVTDAFQFVVIAGTAVGLVIWLLHINGAETLINGIGGISHEYGHLFDEQGISVFLGFGLSSAIGLLSGPFGDQAFWQRAFSVEEGKVKRSFIIGALLFAIVPLSIGIIGFIAAGQGFTTADTGNLTFHYIISALPAWVMIPFVIMMLSGLLSTVDSNLCAISSLTTDISDKADTKTAKCVMSVVLCIAVIIANIPNLTVTHLFLFYGTLRASTLLPTILTLKGVKLPEKGVYRGIIASICVGLPIFAIGNIFNINGLKIIGSILSVLLSGIIALAMRDSEVAK